MASSAKGGAQLDQKSKVKLIAASAVLVIAVVWIVYWFAMMNAKPSTPSLSASEKAALEEEHTQQLEKVKEETNKGYRGGKPPGPPGAS